VSLHRAARTLGTILLAICGWMASSTSLLSQTPSAPSGLETYLGSKISTIEFKSRQPDQSTKTSPESGKLAAAIPLKDGEILTSQNLHAGIQALYATGRFANIEVTAVKTPDGGVALAFVTEPNFFVGSVNVQGEPRPPSANQLANATKLELGELFDRSVLSQAIDRLKRVLEDNGYYRAAVNVDYEQNSETQQVNLFFNVIPGDQALVGKVTVQGDAGMGKEEVENASHMHPGDKVTPAKVTRALTKLRKKYQKGKRLESQVSLVQRVYNPTNNTVDFAFQIQRGPKVEISVEGTRLRQGLIKKYVPVYEENAVDDDLLNEGKKNLKDYLQTEGYFDATVNYTRHEDKAAQQVSVIYDIDRGSRHKFTSLKVSGNKYFDEDTIRERMQIAPSSLLLFYGRFSQSMLNGDLEAVRALYITNGFRSAKVDGHVDDDCNGRHGDICVDVQISEGPQTLVESLSIEGNKSFPDEELRDLVSTTDGQPYSEFNVSTDRESIASFYFNRGFPNVKFEAFADPDPKEPARMKVRYVITEGTQQFIRQVMVTGAEHTRPYVIDRELTIAPGQPLSQIEILETQKKLYDLGIFSEVNVAIQNPEGSLPDKNVLVEVEEAKRYTFTYGFGFEAQTGDTSNCLSSSTNGGQTVTCSPQGATGASPRFSFDVTRINFLGRDHTVLLKTVLGRLQQRGLISYEAPHWFNNADKTLTFDGFYDKTQDVTTFTAEREEASAQVRHIVNKGTTLLYGLTYRRVRVDASTLQVSQDQIPLLSKPVRVGFPNITFIRDTRDNPITSTRGTYTTADFSVASSIFGSQSSYAKILVQNSTYYQLNKNAKVDRRWVLARSTQIGVEEPFGSPDQAFLPLPERFYSGGANSNRAFAINQAGPRDLQTGFVLGGGALFVNNIELRTPPIDLPFVDDNISLVFFHDMGNAFDSAHHMFKSLFKVSQSNVSECEDVNNPNAGCDFNYIAHALGTGLRYKTPIGPIRFDLGYTLNPGVFPVRTTTPPHFETLPHFTFVFSIGQTF